MTDEPTPDERRLYDAERNLAEQERLTEQARSLVVSLEAELEKARATIESMSQQKNELLERAEDLEEDRDRKARMLRACEAHMAELERERDEAQEDLELQRALRKSNR